MLHKTLDRTAFTCGVSPLKKNDNSLTGFFNPSLQLQQLNLKREFFFFICFTVEAIFVWINSGAPVSNQNIVRIIIAGAGGCEI